MITVICSDSRDMKEVENASVDIIVTSPPYNVNCQYSLHDDNMTTDEYELLLYDVFSECDRTLKKGGRIAVNIPWGVGRNPYLPVYPRVLQVLNNFFNLSGTIVWKKTGSSNLTSWGSWRSPVSPSLRDYTEAIIVAHKSGKFDVPDGALEHDENGRKVSPWLSSQRFMVLTNDCWEISPTQPSKTHHPAAFPPEIPKRVIELFGYPGCTVLDPFAGSGSTGVAADQLGCNAILYDIDKIYCELMTERLVRQRSIFSDG